jgi:hypothetical protein
MIESKESLVDLIIQKRKIEFSFEETEFHDSLFKEEILVKKNENICLLNFETIAPIFLEKYKVKLCFIEGADFKLRVELIQNVRKDFLSSGFVQNFHLLEKELWKKIVSEHHNEKNGNFTDYLHSIDVNNKPEGIFQFIEAYSHLLPTFQLSSDEILENAKIKLDIVKSDAHYNIPLSTVLNGIRNTLKSKYKLGLEIFYKAILLDGDKENLISAIVTGLYENKGGDFYQSHLKGLIEKGQRVNPIFVGLSNISSVNKSDSELLAELIESHIEDETLTISLLSLIFLLLNSSHNDFDDFCFEKIRFLLKREESAYFILGNLNRVENNVQTKTELINKIIRQPYFTIDKYMESISHSIWLLKDFNSFKSIVLNLIKTKPFEKFIHKFQSYFPGVETLHLDKFLLKLLVSNKACKRYIGIELFDELSKDKPYRFTYDILNLPYLKQYKLWVSLTEDFHQPKDRLVALLPLLNSKSQVIRESFMFKLEVVTEDYGGHIVKLLEEELELSNPANIEIVDRIRKYNENFYNINITPKREILEFNPYQRYHNHIRLFDELFSKKMNDVGKAAKENSLISLLGMNTVHLAKGGGWKIGDRKDISQLSKIGASFVMPRSFFINQNEFELEKGFKKKENWTKEYFSVIQKMLESE